MKKADKEKFIESMEDVKDRIREVQDGVRALKATGISDEMLYHMIQKSSPNVGPKRTPVPIKIIKGIVQGLDRLYEVTFPDDGN
jgi:hypothetical protein